MAPLPDFAQVAFKKIAQEGAGDGNRGEPADVVPGWRDRGAHDVGRELERQTGDKVARIIEPGFAYRLMERRLEQHHSETCDKRLDRSDRDDDHRHRFEEETNIARRNA